MNKRVKSLLHLFFRGLVILAPIGITIYAIYSVFSIIDNLLPFNLPTGLGFLLVVALITAIGLLGTRYLFGRWFFDALDSLMERTPGIRFLYTAVKEIVDSFAGDKNKFKRPVWVKVNESPDRWRIGFITQDDLKDQFPVEGLISVYLPHAYAISGWVVMVHLHDTRPVENMTAAEAMKFAVSGGIAGIELPSED